MASRVIGRLPVVYNPATRRVEVESAGEFVETQLFQRLDELAKDHIDQCFHGYASRRVI